MIEEIILENDELIKGILDTIYTDIPKLTPVTSTLDKSYISYHLETGDYPLLTVNLNEQSIFPTGYLISVINGHPGNENREFKPHRDKQRHYSILYVYTDEICETNWYTSNTDPKNFFYEEKDLTLKQTFKLHPRKFYKFNHQEIHGVKKINSQRITISINLKYSI
jgi:hypothetical protein|tara:strand:+ start:201 stop:698 length:498 start_codon:yes stop_codon:yes gene_type:complete